MNTINLAGCTAPVRAGTVSTSTQVENGAVVRRTYMDGKLVAVERLGAATPEALRREGLLR